MRNGEIRELVEQAPDEDLPKLAGQLREAEVIMEMRIKKACREAVGESAAVAGEPLTYEQLAQHFKVSVSYLKTLVSQDKIPYIRMPASDLAGKPRDSRRIRFDLAEVREAFQKLGLGGRR